MHIKRIKLPNQGIERCLAPLGSLVMSHFSLG